jgi:large subunit ribosomal protein L5e
MPFVKIQKNNVYSKRFQVKFRRRRLGKTDYYQRKRLTLQRKNKYNTAKWRFVVRRTNKRIICQFVWNTLKGDKVKSYADSYELQKYGITAGLTNFAAAYATGLLCSRRLLSILDKENEKKDIKTKMTEMFNLIKEPSNDDVDFEALCEEKGVEARPFTAYLDLGLVRATKGNRVFAAMKGAIDGGVHIPHNPKVFPSKKTEEEAEKPKGKKEKEKDGKKGGAASKPKKKEEKKEDEGSTLKGRIYGVHVQEYMDLYDKNKDKQEYQFSKWKECLKKAGVKTVEDLYKKAHAEIRKNPLKEETKKEKPKYIRDKDDKNIIVGPDGKKFRRDFKLTNQQRKERVKAKIEEFLKSRNK